MNINTADLFGAQIAPELKKRGFNKRKLNWYRREKDVTICLYIQKSFWGKDVWYYNYGICINALHEKPVYTIDYFDVVERFDQKLNRRTISACIKEDIEEYFNRKDDDQISPEDVIYILDYWIEQFGSIDKLKIRSKKGDLTPKEGIWYIWTTAEARKYLSETLKAD